MSESLTEVEYLRRDNKRLRQQCSAEGKEMYAERLKDAVRRAEERELDACAEADELRTDAERYRKLKASRGMWAIEWSRLRTITPDNFDAAVDALPEPGQTA